MTHSLCTFVLLLSLATSARAQSTADPVAAGDRAHAAFDAAGALRRYESALAIDPRRYDALWKASRNAVDVGEASRGGEQRMLYRRAEQYARRAIDANPRDAEGHFALARALGRTALAAPIHERVRHATEIRAAALEALALAPRHAGALHVLGLWHAEVMRLNGVTRLMARRVLGGAVLGTASWREAIRNLEAAVEAEPQRIVHRIDLATVYADAGDATRARAEYEQVVRLPATDPSDRWYKEQASRALGRRP